MSRFSLSRALAAAERAGFVRQPWDEPMAYLDWIPVHAYESWELWNIRVELVCAGVRLADLGSHPKMLAFLWGEHLERRIQARFDRLCHAR